MLNPSIRNDFPILNTKVNGNPLVYFDNTATTQKPKVVVDKLVEYYTQTNANIHRGIHHLSEKATEEYDESKTKVKNFINAKSEKEIIYTKNTTEAINLIACSLALSELNENDLIISTEMEHHSNIVPWQMLAEKVGTKLEFVPVNDEFELDLKEYKKLLKQKPKLITFLFTSNVIGTVNPVIEMTDLAHEAGSLVLVDGAQAVQHEKIDVQKLDFDFLVFSSHKMCGPTGIGVLYGKEEILDQMYPFMGGGDMIDTVTLEKSTWNKLPWKFEAGTPNIADGIAFGTAVDYLTEVGIKNIAQHEKEITSYALEEMKSIEQVEIFGKDNMKNQRGGMISFTIKGVHPHDIAQLLNEEGIAIRSGHHCAQPLHNRFDKTATARASFYIYNTKEEVDKMVASLKDIIKMFK